ncbi:protein spaetzle 3 [Sitodiplosis mosellana]|uniref:protein spaetzle 3 n=1 Tax=Sitodiplosis mosellana TaxID=263140 RepID=UPI002443D64C|nr:protein spaetzle 3 [Sitodiplosis mosellana]
MALMNFSLPFSGSVAPSNWITTANPLQQPHATVVNELLYSPEGHQADSTANGPQFYKNDPYSHPTQHQQQQQHQSPHYQRQTFHYRSRATANNYLPPPPSNFNHERPPIKSQHIPQLQPPLETGNNNGDLKTRTVTNYQSHHQTQAFGDSRYEAHEFYNENISSSFNNSDVDSQPPAYDSIVATATPQPPITNEKLTIENDGKTYTFPANRPTYTQVQAGHGSKTQVHAVLDYDNDEYYDEENVDPKDPSLTPIQGPIFIKNGSVPVVPLFSYPTMNNGTFIRIPIWWTALSVALGLEIRGDVIKGTPCVKRNNQLFCPTAGNSYPIERIEEFIDENKALMRRMYGDFRSTQFREPPIQTRRKRDATNYDNMPGIPDITAPFNAKLNLYPEDTVMGGDTFFGHIREKRQAKQNKANQKPSIPNPNPSTEPSSNRVDACESKIEIVTPYWASNSAGKIRAIVNTQHFEQAIHQEVCTKMQTNRCGGDCGCEQKYKWHRLLAYDPDNDCMGIFMDWFLFPSCCVCRCNKT